MTGSGPRCTVHALWPIASSSWTPTHVWPGPGWPTWPPGSGSEWPGAGVEGCVLTAELGLLGYEPTPADPFVFNHRAFPSATMLSDASAVLGGIVPSPGCVTIGCLGAAILDGDGNIDSTVVPGRTFLVGSGGGNDVASTADDVVVVTTLTGRRTVDHLDYITSPGDRCSSTLATDLGLFAKGADGRLALVALADGVTVDEVRAVCGWELAVTDDVAVLEPVTLTDVEPLRRWDPRGFFLRA